MEKSKLKEAIAKTGGNMTQTAKLLGVAVSSIHYHRQKDPEIAKAIAIARGKVLVDEPDFLDSRTSEFRTNVDDEEIYTVLIDCEGDITQCADRLELHPLTLRNRINGNPMLLDGQKDAIALRHDKIKDSLYRAALGEETIPASQMRAKELIARTQMGWTAAKAPKPKGNMHDPSSVPLEVTETAKPLLRRIK